MWDFAVLLIILGICCILSGPAALIISIIALKNTKQKNVPAKQTTKPIIQKPLTPPPVPKPKPVTATTKTEILQKQPENDTKCQKQKNAGEALELEQKIGTKWILIAGIITVMVGIGFLLKYAYDNFSVGPTGRTIAVAIGGIFALVTGEITRRRDYGIVAKGVTALGFAILYAAVFAAYQLYNLIGFGPAFITATLITIVAMAYAVVLNEMLIAFLSLLGGFLTPAIAMSNTNSPVPLFIYMLILAIGAMVCAFYRRWRAINLLSFLGTFGLYTIWFYNSEYCDNLCAGQPLSVNAICFILGWLSVFFVIYLVMPISYGLAKKAKTNSEDVCLILVNAAVALFYLYTILFDFHRGHLALATIAIAVIHLMAAFIVTRQHKEDKNLQLILQAIAIFFATLAVPLYLKLNATTITWAAEAVMLTLIGLRYSSKLTQAWGFIVMIASSMCLIYDTPIHVAKFSLVLNSEFGTWCFVAIAIYLCHLFYRKKSQTLQEYDSIGQILYGCSVVIVFAAASMEWFLHCKYNLLTETSMYFIAPGQLIIFATIAIIFLPGLLRPKGFLSEIMSLVLLAAGSLFTIISLTHLHCKNFVIFANPNFAAVFAFLMAILTYQIKYRKNSESFNKYSQNISQFIYGALGLLFLATVSAEWYWYCEYGCPKNSPVMLRGFILILAVIIPLFIIRPISSGGLAVIVPATGLAIIGAMFTITNFYQIHTDSFTIFFNLNFAIALAFVASLFLSAIIFNGDGYVKCNGKNFAFMFFLGAILTLWIILTEEIYIYFDCYNRFAAKMTNWKILAQMFISLMWAIYATVLIITGFWKKVRMLRYISLVLFALLLGKIFLIDTQTVSNIYRVTAFMVTGITLVGISYLYQFLRKKGFF